MKITILMMAIFVAGLVDLDGYQGLAILLIIVATIEFWYESSPFRMHKRRIEHREKVKAGPSLADVLLVRMGTISTAWIFFLIAILVSGGVAGMADIVVRETQSLTEFFNAQDFPDIREFTGVIRGLLWIALLIGAVLTALQLMLGKERFDFD